MKNWTTTLKTFVFTLLAILGFSSTYAATKLPLTNAIGLAITPKGQEYFKENLPALLKSNSLEIGNIYFPGTEVVGDETKTEDLVEDPELKEVILQAKEILNRFFEGLDLDTHQLKLGVEDILFKAKWEEIALDIVPPTRSELKSNYTAVFHLRLAAKNIQVNVSKIRGSDLKNPWIGELGIDQFELSTKEESHPLEIELNLGFYQEARGKFRIDVLTPKTNLDELIMGYSFASPLVLPKVEVQINERKLRLRNEEIEKLLIEQQDNILTRVKAILQEKMETEIPSSLGTVINETLEKGFKEVNQMNPPGSPSESEPKFVWALGLQEVKYHEGSLLLDFDARFDDTIRGTGKPLAASQMASAPANLIDSRSGSSDFIFSLNQGVLNRVIQLSSDRGYFNEIALESGEAIKLVKTPYINMKGSKGTKMALEIEYKVTGFAAVFVKNPIHINFDLNLAFPISNDGKVKMVVDSIDLDSANVDDKYIRMFGSKVRAAVKEKLAEVNGDMKGYMLTDDIPIPDDLGGITLKKVATQIDKNGHLKIYSEIKK